MQFAFATAQNILFGPGSIAQVAPHAARLGRRVLLMTGRNPNRAAILTKDLDAAGLSWVPLKVMGEPCITQAVEGADMARREKCDLIIGMGGGSVLDAAKAVAALATNTAPVDTYLEVIGLGQPLQQIPLPCIAIATTAGTGSEVTRNAVLKSVRRQVKVSLRSPFMLPVLAVVDPELTLSVPPDVTAATGCDALTQLLEAFVSVKANPMTDALCREALPRAARALLRAVRQGDDLEARSQMALASLFSGLSLANGGLGAVHGIAGPLGGMIDAPHGALCARLLPHVVQANVDALTRHAPDSAFLERYQQIACMLTGSSHATIGDGIDWLHRLIAQLNIPSLSHWGLGMDDVSDLGVKALQAGSMKGNPIHLDKDSIKQIIVKALQED